MGNLKWLKSAIFRCYGLLCGTDTNTETDHVMKVEPNMISYGGGFDEKVKAIFSTNYLKLLKK